MTAQGVGGIAGLPVFAARFGFPDDSPRLLAALTHTSAAASVPESMERLEFLGDALLSAFVARYLFEHLPPDTREDVLSRARVQVVRKETLAAAGHAIGLADLIAVGQGERKEQRNRRDSIVADAFEAVLAALYLDAGEAVAHAFLRETLAAPLAEVIAHPPDDDPKTRLQIRLQAEGKPLPHYETIAESRTGEQHQFIVEVRDASGTLLGQGTGPSKRIAQRNAALIALGSR